MTISIMIVPFRASKEEAVKGMSLRGGYMPPTLESESNLDYTVTTIMPEASVFLSAELTGLVVPCTLPPDPPTKRSRLPTITPCRRKCGLQSRLSRQVGQLTAP